MPCQPLASCADRSGKGSRNLDHCLPGAEEANDLASIVKHRAGSLKQVVHPEQEWVGTGTG
jgi:hypothetical protein